MGGAIWYKAKKVVSLQNILYPLFKWQKKKKMCVVLCVMYNYILMWYFLKNSEMTVSPSITAAAAATFRKRTVK